MDVQNEGKISAIAKERQYKRAYNHIKKDFNRLTANMPYPIQLTIFMLMMKKEKLHGLMIIKQVFQKLKLIRVLSVQWLEFTLVNTLWQ